MRQFTIDDLNQFPSWLSETIDKGARRGMLSAGARIVNDIVTRVIPAEPRMPVDRGIYRAGWQFEATEGGVAVYNATPQAPIIEWGVRAERVKPGKAMIDALTQWVQRKGIGTSRAQASGGVKKPGISKVRAPPSLASQITKPVKDFVKKLSRLLKVQPTSGGGGGKGGKGSASLGDDEARGIAWAIARNMQKKGIFNNGKGLRILEKATKMMPRILETEITREITRAFR